MSMNRRTALKSLAALPLVPMAVQEERTPIFGLRPGEKFPTFEVHQINPDTFCCLVCGRTKYDVVTQQLECVTEHFFFPRMLANPVFPQSPAETLFAPCPTTTTPSATP